MEDRVLVDRLIEGDLEAWNAVVQDHTPLLSAMAARVLSRPGESGSADVEDAVQAVFAKLWADGRRRLRTFEGRPRLSTWLAAIARREALDRLRVRRRVEAHQVNGIEDLQLERTLMALGRRPEQRVASDDDTRRLREALIRLADRDRLLILWIHQDGLSYAQTAELLGVRENSIGPLLGRARRRLDALIDGGSRSLYGTPPVAPPTRRSGS